MLNVPGLALLVITPLPYGYSSLLGSSLNTKNHSQGLHKASLEDKGTPVREVEDALRADGEGGEDLPAELAVARVPVLLVRQREEVCAQRTKDIAETGPQIR